MKKIILFLLGSVLLLAFLLLAYYGYQKNKINEDSLAITKNKILENNQKEITENNAKDIFKDKLPVEDNSVSEEEKILQEQKIYSVKGKIISKNSKGIEVKFENQGPDWTAQVLIDDNTDILLLKGFAEPQVFSRDELKIGEEIIVDV